MKAIRELLSQAKALLEQAGTENAENEVRWIFESVSGVTREERYLRGIDGVDDGAADLFMQAVTQRSQGRPLQYILGEWDFCGHTFKVGEGVLVPRPETELLVERAASFLQGKKEAAVLDLCSGSGCVGLSIAIENPGAEVYLFEKSAKAIEYLERNIEFTGVKNAIILTGDVFDGAESNAVRSYDLIVSNPPYIATGKLSELSVEVRNEPSMALDGGRDGLDFYRAICEKWVELVKPGGMVAVECGEEQTQDIGRLFARFGDGIKMFKDFNGLPRVVTANVKG